MQPFWTEDPSVLYKDGNYTEIIPNSKQTVSARENSWTRLMILLFILFLIFTGFSWLTAIPVLVILVIYLIHLNKEESDENVLQTAEKFHSKTLNQWLSENMGSCKMNGKSCQPYQDVRYHKN